MYKKHQITALDSKDALLLGYSKNRSKKFDIKDTEGWTYNKCFTRVGVGAAVGKVGSTPTAGLFDPDLAYK